MFLSPETTNALLERHGVPHVQESACAAGSLVMIRCFSDPTGRFVRISSSDYTAVRILPVSADQAESMLASMRAERNAASNPQLRRMVAHVVASLGKLFDHEHLAEMQVELCVHEGGYAVMAAEMYAARAVNVNARPAQVETVTAVVITDTSA